MRDTNDQFTFRNKEVKYVQNSLILSTNRRFGFRLLEV